MTQLAEETRAPHTTSQLAERLAMRYLLYFLILPVLALVFPFVAERAKPLQELSGSKNAGVLEYSYRAAGENADVVIFGDSAALFGVDTVRISHELGLKVINLPNYQYSLPITGDRALRNYLATNKAPRVIVFYFTPWSLDIMSLVNSATFEGDEQVLRHGTNSDLLRLLVRRPKDLLEFPKRFYYAPSRITSFFKHEPFHPGSTIQGHALYERTTPLPDDCSIPKEFTHNTNSDSVQQLMRDFSNGNTKVLIYLAPIPDCEHAADVVAMRYPGINVAPSAVLPHQIFAKDLAYVHILTRYTSESTDLFAKSLKEALRNNY